MTNILPEILEKTNFFFNPKYFVSSARIRQFKSLYFGKRCFIIGNGPSLNKTNLLLLKNEYTFGLNRIYLLFPKLGFETNFLVSVNNLVLSQVSQEINSLQIPKFLTWRSNSYINFDKYTSFLRSVKGPWFSRDPSMGVWEGGTVTYVAMQLAYYFGFSQAYLVGVDHNFQTTGPAGKTITQKGRDPNHFSGEYFGNGFKWQLPDLITSELAYRLAQYEFEKSGRRIYDATVDGKLSIFPKVKLEKILK